MDSAPLPSLNDIRRMVGALQAIPPFDAIDFSDPDALKDKCALQSEVIQQVLEAMGVETVVYTNPKLNYHHNFVLCRTSDGIVLVDWTQSQSREEGGKPFVGSYSALLASMTDEQRNYDKGYPDVAAVKNLYHCVNQEQLDELYYENRAPQKIAAKRIRDACVAQTGELLLTQFHFALAEDIKTGVPTYPFSNVMAQLQATWKEHSLDDYVPKHLQPKKTHPRMERKDASEVFPSAGKSWREWLGL